MRSLLSGIDLLGWSGVGHLHDLIRGAVATNPARQETLFLLELDLLDLLVAIKLLELDLPDFTFYRLKIIVVFSSTGIIAKWDK